MIEAPRRAYLLWNLEPRYDTADPAATMNALAEAGHVIVCSPFRGDAMDYADAILPIAPFTETFGTFVNAEGRAQSFQGVVAPFAETRPGWKVLRVLGNQLGLAGFEYDEPEAVRADALPADIAAALSNDVTNDAANNVANDAATEPRRIAPGAEIERIADVPVYWSDAIVRRAAALQRTPDAAAPKARANAATLARLGVQAGARVRVTQGETGAQFQFELECELECALDERLPAGVVRVAAAHALTAPLGAMFGPIRLEPV